MGTGTAGNAANEAAYGMGVAGPKLIAFRMCNQPDLFYCNGIRKADHDFAQFAAEWRRYFQAVRARVRNAPFAGPATAYNNDWLSPFAKQFKNDVALLSQHHYAKGPPTDPAMTIERLLRPEPKLQAELAAVRQAAKESSLPVRLAEMNTRFQGGKPGGSDTFASALWSADLMYQPASEGGAGINFHGGGYRWYTAIAGTPQAGFLARPSYYEMLFVAQAGAGQLVESQLASSAASPLLTAYALRSNTGAIEVAAFNKNADRGVRLAIEAGQHSRGASVLRLVAPRRDDTADTAFGGAPVGAGGAWPATREETLPGVNRIWMLELPAASAAVITFERE
jgi:hypothetical protein